MKLKRFSRIFLLIGGILGYVYGACLALCAVVFYVLATPMVIEPLKEAIADGRINGPEGASPEVAVTAVQIIFLTTAIILTIWVVLCFLSAVFAFKARNQGDKKSYILNMVFGLISGTEFNVAGGILGYIAETKRKPNVIDAE